MQSRASGGHFAGLGIPESSKIAEEREAEKECDCTERTCGSAYAQARIAAVRDLKEIIKGIFPK